MIKNYNPSKMINSEPQKIFIVGDKWLYYKIYCGVKTADTLLISVIKPISEYLLKNGLIDKWFFIRYSDPEPHLRIRFHITKIENLYTIIDKIKTLIMPYIISTQVWDIQLATYKRELERYGEYTIEHSESFFFYDSQHCIAIIENSEDDSARFLTVFKWVAYLISLFDFNAQEQLSFLNRMQKQFKEEFKVHKTVTKELNLKYKDLENSIRDDTTMPYSKRELKVITLKILKLSKEQTFGIPLDSLLSSYIHMTINRSFRSKQRLYEMVIYDFLHKKNKTNFTRYGKL
jgi:thiopeptide-type bacteriocin biosynthesis protein